MQTTLRTPHLIHVLFLLLVLPGVACEEGVDPNLGIDLPFTLWGVIDAKATVHTVRVFEVVPTIELIRPDPLDAVLSSTLLQTGTIQTWQDSVIQLRDGDYRHVYWSEFEVEAGQTYRIEARRSDGALSWAEVTVPPPVDLVILEPSLTQANEILLPLFIRGEPPSLPKVELEYFTVGVSADGSDVVDFPVLLSYDTRTAKSVDGYLLDVDLRRDLAQIRARMTEAGVPSALIDLRHMTLRVHVGNEGWESPVGVFDPDFLVEPGILSNVNNGFGFVGAGYIESVTWRPPAILLDRAGFDVGSSQTESGTGT